MANSKISALTSATTVAGSEVLPIVQSSATVKVSVANLTPGLGTITAAKGGTGQTSYAIGDLLYANTTTTLAKLPDVATGNALISGGVGVAPSWGKIGLTTHVSGTLAVGNGGTGLTSLASGYIPYGNATSAFNSSSDLTYNGVLTVGPATGQNGVFDVVVGSAAATTGDNSGVVIVSNTTGQGWLGFNNGNNAGIPGQVTYNHNTNVMDFYSSGTYSFSNGNVKLTTGNLIIGTSGKGIDFSATADGPGMTSEILNDYEEGTWTPTDASGAGLTFTSVTGLYTKIGRQVTCTFGLTFPATVSGASVTLGSLPFTAIGSGTPNPSGGSITYTGAAISAAGFAVGAGGTTVSLYGASGAAFVNASFSGFILRAQFTYTAT